MISRPSARLAVVFFLLASLSAHAFDLEQRVVELQLPNGMRWLLVRRPQAPVFSGIVMVRAGSSEEEPGKTGLAHMFEHMAFKGSDRLGTRNFSQEKPLLDELNRLGRLLTAATHAGESAAAERTELQAQFSKAMVETQRAQIPNEVWEVMVRNGASELNAFTSKDFTAFHASMPINRLSLWATVIAEMVGRPVLREFYTERDVVAEERRMSVDNDPDGLLAEALLNAAFTSGPYHWSTIGLASDITGLNDQDAEAFHRRYYVAGNMVGVLVGAIDIAETRAILTRAFSIIPPGKRGGDPLPSDPRGGVHERLTAAAQPSLVMAFHKPTLPHREEYTFDLLASLLCDGSSSRLKRRLVVDERLVHDVTCTDSYPGGRLPNLFVIWLEPIGGKKIAAIEQAVQEELARLQAEAVSTEELAAAQRRTQSHLLYSLEDNMELAVMLAEFATTYGDWRLLAHYPERLGEVSAEDVQTIAKRYFVDENRVVVERTAGGRGGR